MLKSLPDILIPIVLNVIHMLFYLRLKTGNPLTLLLALAMMFVPVPLLRALFAATGLGVPLLTTAASLLYVAYCLWVFRLLATNDGYRRVYFAGASVLIFMQMLRIASIVVIVYGFRMDPAGASRLSWYFVTPAALLLFPLLYRHARGPFMKILDIAETQKWHLVAAPPLAFLLLSVGARILLTDAPVSSHVFMMGVATPVAILAYFISMFGFLANKNDKLVYRQRLEAAEQLEHTYEFYNRELAEKEGRLRTLRHDFRHLVTHLQTLAGERDFDGILRELRAVSGTAAEVTVTPFCENRTVNAIVSFHFARAEKLGVNCVAKTFVPEKLALPDAELALLLGNALENCVKAAGPLGERGYITFDAKPARGYMMFVFANNHEPGKYTPGEGAGLASVRQLCEERNGWMQVEEGKDEYRLTVFLRAL